jgi:cytochrome c-type biogenesis protein CcmE
MAMTRKRRRMVWVGMIGLALAGAAALVLTALEEEIVFFYSPSDVTDAARTLPDGRFRLGGMVQKGSLETSWERADGLPTVRFVVTDFRSTVPVTFSGALPDLFREGQGVVAEGRLGADGTFAAADILAKHDENYMSPEVADALKRAGMGPDGKPHPGMGGTGYGGAK